MKRYLLIGNQRIIDTHKYTLDIVSKHSPNYLSCEVIYSFKNDEEKIEINENNIISSSDNILDLIEAGDLVKYEGAIYQVTYVYKYEDSNLYDIGTKGLIFDSRQITAIYKPNFNKGYNLVWECD